MGHPSYQFCVPQLVKKRILSIPLQSAHYLDRLIWKHSTDEAFSIKTSYFQATHPSGPHIPSSSLISGDYWKKFWKIKLVPNSLA